LTLAHEARVQFLNHFGCNGEKDLGDGAGIIMVDAAIQFKAEIFYPGELIARLSTDHITERSFDLYYKFILKNNLREAALIKTGIVCFDYQKRRPSVLPAVFKQQLENTKI
jgi:acyl-CoA thioesterase FadM